ncbi:MAG: hypothetical protein ABI218_03875 [Caldimonas sp.]
MFARVSAFVIWSLVAATAVFWLLRLTASSPQAPAYASAVGKSTVVRGDLNRLFGAPAVVVSVAEAGPAAPSRFKLVGVMAPRSKQEQSVPGSGLALIAVDGKPPKAFTVGASLDSGLVVQSVGLRTASIGPAQGERSMLLELPALVPPSTGVLPPSGFGAPPMSMGGGIPPQPGIPVPEAAGSHLGSPPGLPVPGMPVPAGGAMGMPHQPVPPGTALPPPPRLPANDNLRSQ